MAILQVKFQSSYTTPMSEALLRGDCVGDEHGTQAQDIFQKQFPDIHGMQLSLLSQTSGFIPVKKTQALQIHHINGTHGCTSSSVGQAVAVFDSSYTGVPPSFSLTHQLAVIYRYLMV